MSDESKCPVTGGGPWHPVEGTTNHDWWPDQIDLSNLHRNAEESNPMGADFDYAAAFAAVDLDALKKDIETAVSQLHSQRTDGRPSPFFVELDEFNTVQARDQSPLEFSDNPGNARLGPLGLDRTDHRQNVRDVAQGRHPEDAKGFRWTIEW